MKGQYLYNMPEPETPFRIVILGDFSGRINRGICETADIAKRKPFHVDRDNLDEVMAGFNVEIKLPLLGKDSSPVNIRFSKLDDFHPDYLFENLEAFQALRDMRKSLKNPSTFSSLAKKFRPVRLGFLLFHAASLK